VPGLTTRGGSGGRAAARSRPPVAPPCTGGASRCDHSRPRAFTRATGCGRIGRPTLASIRSRFGPAK
jgi:hypothetical protein